MQHRIVVHGAVSLMLLVMLTAGCEPSRSADPTEPGLQGRLTARGQPMVIRHVIDFTGTIPAGFFCPDVDVQAHSTGILVSKIWTAGELLVDETLFKEEGRVDNTFTHPITGKSVTSHQAGTVEFVVVGFEVVEAKLSGTPVRVLIPGEGLVEYFIGHVKVSFDFSTTPPTVTEAFHGRQSSGDLCALIS